MALGLSLQECRLPFSPKVELTAAMAIDTTTPKVGNIMNDENCRLPPLGLSLPLQSARVDMTIDRFIHPLDMDFECTCRLKEGT